MSLGQAHASVVATNREIQLNDFTADIFKGRASGSARVAISGSGTSQIIADFSGLDIAGPLTAVAAGGRTRWGLAVPDQKSTFFRPDVQITSGPPTAPFSAR